MRLLRRRSRPTDPVAYTTHQGSGALVVALHGYGATEMQLSTLAPLDLPIVQVAPRAPLVVDPGFGWWEASLQSDGRLELAPSQAVNAAIDLVTRAVHDAQRCHGFTAEQTVLLGYSQGAVLGLATAARHPELITAVVTCAGFLLPGEAPRPADPGLDVLVLNGSVDPLTSRSDHDRSVESFASAGHNARGRISKVPHVIDEAQADLIQGFIAGQFSSP